MTPSENPRVSAAESGSETNGRVGDILSHITDDMKTIARDEIELVRDELSHSAKMAITEASVAMLGAIVALIGLSLLCVAAVVALAPLIAPLWARLLIMAAVYLVIGGGVAASFGKRLTSDAMPHLGVAQYEAKRTMKGAVSTLTQS
jgi:hypothetical protein